MSDRFYSAMPITTDRVSLDGPEAHHLLHVMRASVGDQVTLFDGSGAEFSAVVEKLGRSNVEFRVVDRLEIDRELPFPLVVGVALPKGDRQKWLVEKLTELGVSTLVPLETTRGVAQPTDSVLERLQRSVIEAAKQCGRNRLMQISTPKKWSDWIHQPEVTSGDSPAAINRRLLAHPGGVKLSGLALATPAPTTIAIGPEGGFTHEEVQAASSAGWQLVELGPRILRIETAAVAFVSAVTLE